MTRHRFHHMSICAGTSSMLPMTRKISRWSTPERPNWTRFSPKTTRLTPSASSPAKPSQPAWPSSSIPLRSKKSHQCAKRSFGHIGHFLRHDTGAESPLTSSARKYPFVSVSRRRCGRGRHGRPWPCEWDVGREPDRDERSEPPTATPPTGLVKKTV